MLHIVYKMAWCFFPNTMRTAHVLIFFLYKLSIVIRCSFYTCERHNLLLVAQPHAVACLNLPQRSFWLEAPLSICLASNPPPACTWQIYLFFLIKYIYLCLYVWTRHSVLSACGFGINYICPSSYEGTSDHSLSQVSNLNHSYLHFYAVYFFYGWFGGKWCP